VPQNIKIKKKTPVYTCVQRWEEKEELHVLKGYQDMSTNPKGLG
jgi:hypothetical protein